MLQPTLQQEAICSISTIYALQLQYWMGSPCFLKQWERNGGKIFPIKIWKTYLHVNASEFFFFFFFDTDNKIKLTYF